MTIINIERLSPDTVIYLPRLVWGNMDTRFECDCTVTAIEFDGHGYALTLGDANGWEDPHYVDAAGYVEFGGRGEPKLRAESDVSVDEWQAKIEANDAAIARLIETQNRRSKFWGAMAKALEV